MRLNEKNFN
jgi:hypothetical protein